MSPQSARYIGLPNDRLLINEVMHMVMHGKRDIRRGSTASEVKGVSSTHSCVLIGVQNCFSLRSDLVFQSSLGSSDHDYETSHLGLRLCTMLAGDDSIGRKGIAV